MKHTFCRSTITLLKYADGTKGQPCAQGVTQLTADEKVTYGLLLFLQEMCLQAYR